MKIKRRWKVMMILPMIWCILALVLGIPLLEHGYEAWIEMYDSSLLLLGGWFIGTITGVLLFTGAIDAEERENADFKFKDEVFEAYDSLIANKTDRESINQVAIEFDISPSHTRNIVKDYEI